MSLGSAPEFRYLGDEQRALLSVLRRAVAPILNNNLLPHFTDHSVIHSDRLTVLVGQLIEPIQSGPHQLSSVELSVLYAACYLHDIGMQYENAGTTRTISDLDLASPWDELGEDERRYLLRQHHHRISAEMVRHSATQAKPLVGMYLPNELEPASLAALCAAHAIDTASAEYQRLMEGAPSIRMYFVSGLLRIADILDESQNRAQREQARTRRLDVVAQAHRWRHYFTEDVIFDQHEKVINIWFDFPTLQRDEYARVVPALQLPWVEKELARHEAYFKKYGLGWSLRKQVKDTEYSVRESMPDPVLVEMLKQLADDRRRSAEAHRQIVLRQFQEAQPSFDRRLANVNRKFQANEEAGALRDLAAIAQDMWELGSRRGAWTCLMGPFQRGSQLLAPVERVELGNSLAWMMLNDGVPQSAAGVLDNIRATVAELPDTATTKAQYFRTLIPCLIANFDLSAAKAALAELLKLPVSLEEKEEMTILLKEAALLAGDVFADNSSREGDNASDQ